MRVLNLYSGIGGNRKLWEDVEVTAVEYNPEIAQVYKSFFPNDEVIVGDAHEYLEKNWRNFDFIWSSPPCQSHSKVRFLASKSGSYDAIMPNMSLWSEIIFLKEFTNNTNIKFCIENVEPYYEPLVKPNHKIGRHLFWSNFNLSMVNIKDGLSHNERGSSKSGFFDLGEFKLEHRKDQIIRNCVDPQIGLEILNRAKGIKSANDRKQTELF